jgi:hypothetical protein
LRTDGSERNVGKSRQKAVEEDSEEIGARSSDRAEVGHDRGFVERYDDELCFAESNRRLDVEIEIVAINGDGVVGRIDGYGFNRGNELGRSGAREGSEQKRHGEKPQP